MILFVIVNECNKKYDKACEYTDSMSKNPDKTEKSRANFGVSQLPLFNHLGPGCTNRDNFSSIQGRRGLSARIC